MCDRPDAERFADWSGEQVEAEARRLVVQAASDGSWRSIIDPLRALRDRDELLQAFIAEVERQIG